MNAEKEREFLKGFYSSVLWDAKVDAMRDDQVIAIYLRLKESQQKPEQEPDQPEEQGRLF